MANDTPKSEKQLLLEKADAAENVHHDHAAAATYSLAAQIAGLIEVVEAQAQAAPARPVLVPSAAPAPKPADNP